MKFSHKSQFLPNLINANIALNKSHVNLVRVNYVRALISCNQVPFIPNSENRLYLSCLKLEIFAFFNMW